MGGGSTVETAVTLLYSFISRAEVGHKSPTRRSCVIASALIEQLLVRQRISPLIATGTVCVSLAWSSMQQPDGGQTSPAGDCTHPFSWGMVPGDVSSPGVTSQGGGSKPSQSGTRTCGRWGENIRDSLCGRPLFALLSFVNLVNYIDKAVRANVSLVCPTAVRYNSTVQQLHLLYRVMWRGGVSLKHVCAAVVVGGL